MKQIDIQNQPILSFGRIFQIAVTGVKYRLFRAAVTVAVIIVAMAFLMNILTESLIKRSVADSVREQIEDMHRVDRWIARLTIPQTVEEILGQLAQADSDSPYLHEIATMSGRPLDEVAALRDVAATTVRYLRFFGGLDFGRRRVLVGPVESTRIYDRLQEERAWQQFSANLADMRTLRFPTSLDAFQSFLSGWGDLRDTAHAARDGQVRAIASVRDGLGDRPLVQALREADGAFGETVRAAGFTLTPEDAAALSVEVGRLEHTLLIESTINNPGVRQAVAAARDILPGDVTMQLIWTMLRRSDRAEWFLDTMREQGMETGDLTAARIESIAEHRAHARLLAVAERQTMEAGGGLMGIGTRMTWLAFVSMLVCAVGIANAMLMSVTERFREIATLKCLGALDAFIMTVFLIEASLLGLFGGIGGALAGFALAGVRMAITFRALLAQAFPWTDVLAAGLISIVLGMILAAVSAVYPSLRAARLAPMEAMRIE